MEKEKRRRGIFLPCNRDSDTCIGKGPTRERERERGVVSINSIIFHWLIIILHYLGHNLLAKPLSLLFFNNLLHCGCLCNKTLKFTLEGRETNNQILIQLYMSCLCIQRCLHLIFSCLLLKKYFKCKHMHAYICLYTYYLWIKRWD